MDALAAMVLGEEVRTRPRPGGDVRGEGRGVST